LSNKNKPVEDYVIEGLSILARIIARQCIKDRELKDNLCTPTNLRQIESEGNKRGFQERILV
jgi:hypothetical protein